MSQYGPGPEFDVIIARKIFRYVVSYNGVDSPFTYDRQGNIRGIEPFSTSMDAAYNVIKFIRSLNFNISLTNLAIDAWEVTVSKDGQSHTYNGATLPYTICLAGIGVLSS